MTQKKNTAAVQPIHPGVNAGDSVLHEQNLRARIDEICRDDKISQAEIGKQAGVAPPTLSQWMNGTYPAKTARIVAKIDTWLSDYIQRKAKGAVQTPAFIMLPTSRKIYNCLDYARSMGDIVLVYGSAGVGKTETILNYQSTHPSVWHLQISPATASVMSLLEEIAAALGIVGYMRNRAALQREIVKKMTGTRGLLVIDEAQHLGVHALEQLRHFTDTVDIGLVLCGNVFVASQFSAGSKGAYLDRLSSRVGKRLHLKGATRADIDMLVDAWGFNDEKCRQHARDIGSKSGALRVLNKCFALATTIAQSRGRTELCCADLNAAAKELGVFE